MSGIEPQSNVSIIVDQQIVLEPLNTEGPILVYTLTTMEKQVYLPLSPVIDISPVEKIQVDWGDGNIEEYQANIEIPPHSYINVEPTGTIYNVSISATSPDCILLRNFRANSTLTNVISFGTYTQSSLEYAFYNCFALNSVPEVLPTSVTNLSYMFGNNDTIGIVPQPLEQNLSNWDTTNITNMSYMFYNASFNNYSQSLSWNTSNVTNMSYMFYNSPFNQDIGSWNTSNVTNMSYMFYNSPFNQDIGSWNTSNVTNMKSMFLQANSFNQNLNSWNTSKVTDMSSMFSNRSFNNGNSPGMAVSFQPYPPPMPALNPPANTFFSWNVSSVVFMENMFINNIAFNIDISCWNLDTTILEVTNGFLQNTLYSHPAINVITKPNLSIDSNVNEIDIYDYMINEYSAEMQVMTFNGMYKDARLFQGVNLSLIDWSMVVSAQNMLDGSGVTSANYNALLLALAATPTLQTGVILGVQGLVYTTPQAAAARQSVIDKWGWVFVGDRYYNPDSIFPIVCFKENTKILTDIGYVYVQNLKKGTLVKTLNHGFKRLDAIGKKDIEHRAFHERIPDQLYKCSSSSEKYPTLFEDLVITGRHSILVDKFTSDEEREKTREVNSAIYKTDNKFRLPACVDKKAQVYDTPGTYTIYHFALENDNNYTNYGVYANGLLVESCSKKYLKEASKMKLL